MVSPVQSLAPPGTSCLGICMLSCVVQPEMTRPCVQCHPSTQGLVGTLVYATAPLPCSRCSWSCVLSRTAFTPVAAVQLACEGWSKRMHEQANRNGPGLHEASLNFWPYTPRHTHPNASTRFCGRYARLRCGCTSRHACMQKGPPCTQWQQMVLAQGHDAFGYDSWASLWADYTVFATVRNVYDRAGSAYDYLLGRRKARQTPLMRLCSCCCNHCPFTPLWRTLARP